MLTSRRSSKRETLPGKALTVTSSPITSTVTLTSSTSARTSKLTRTMYKRRMLTWERLIAGNRAVIKRRRDSMEWSRRARRRYRSWALPSRGCSKTQSTRRRRRLFREISEPRFKYQRLTIQTHRLTARLSCLQHRIVRIVQWVLKKCKSLNRKSNFKMTLIFNWNPSRFYSLSSQRATNAMWSKNSCKAMRFFS